MWLDGLDHKLNVRGTFDLSSPHVEDDEDEWSSNSFCNLNPEINLPWVTLEHVVHGAAVLRQIGLIVKFFKIDLHLSYQQVVMQRTTTHRLYFYWCHVVQSIVIEGIVRNERLQWEQQLVAHCSTGQSRLSLSAFSCSGLWCVGCPS